MHLMPTCTLLLHVCNLWRCHRIVRLEDATLTNVRKEYKENVNVNDIGLDKLQYNDCKVYKKKDVDG